MSSENYQAEQKDKYGSDSDPTIQEAREIEAIKILEEFETSLRMSEVLHFSQS